MQLYIPNIQNATPTPAPMTVPGPGATRVPAATAASIAIAQPATVDKHPAALNTSSQILT